MGQAASLIDVRLNGIGWSVCQASRRSQISRDRIARWRNGVAEPPQSFMEWLDALHALHQRYATPLSRNVPLSSNRSPMNAYAVSRALITLGWSERRLAEHLGYHRTELRRLLEGGGKLGARPSRWLEMLENGHRDLPRPVISPMSRRPDMNTGLTMETVR